MTSAHHVEGLSFSPEVLERRRATLGASEVPVLAGVNPFKSPLQLWLEKIGQAPSFEGNQFTEWGTRLETVVADAYAEKRGVQIVTSATVIGAESWMSATPDRFIVPVGRPVLSIGDFDRGLEVKCRGEYRGDEWGEPGTDQVPHDVAIQCHWSMRVTGLRRWDVATLIGGNKFRMYELHYDEDIANHLYAIAHEFWFQYVVPKVQPPVDASAATNTFLRKHYRDHNEQLREATPAEAALLATLREVKAELKHMESRELEVQNQIMEAIGHDVGIRAPDGSKVTWKRNANGNTSWKDACLALAKDKGIPTTEVDRYCDAHRGEPARVFRASFPKEK